MFEKRKLTSSELVRKMDSAWKEYDATVENPVEAVVGQSPVTARFSKHYRGSQDGHVKEVFLNTATPHSFLRITTGRYSPQDKAYTGINPHPTLFEKTDDNTWVRVQGRIRA